MTEFYSERGGGVRSHLTQKGRASAELGHEHVVIAPGPRNHEERLSLPVAALGSGDAEAALPKVPRIIRMAGPALPYDPTYHLLWRIDKVRARLVQERPDVLEIDSPYAAALACLSVPARSYGVRTLVWHSDFLDTYARVFSLEGRAARAVDLAWGLVRGLAARCDATFVASRWMEEKLVQRGVPRVVRVPFGVDRARFTPEARAAAFAWPFPERRERAPVLVAVGRLAVEKAWGVVLDAFARVRARRPVTLAIFGDGPERRALEAQARGLGGDVAFLGFETDRAKLASALASADALVHGCPHETFGLAVAEALCAGLPCVVPDAGGAAEAISPSSGARYRAGDPAACARAIEEVLDRRERDREGSTRGALAAAASIPTTREQFARTFEVYASLLEGGARGAGRLAGLS